MGLLASQALANLRAWLWLFGLPSYWPVVGLIAVNNSKFLLAMQFSYCFANFLRGKKRKKELLDGCDKVRS